LKARQDFVNSCPLFNTWAPKYKRQAFMSLRKELYQFDSIIIKQGTPLGSYKNFLRFNIELNDILFHSELNNICSNLNSKTFLIK